MIEIQRAVATAETRAIEMIAQERIKMEKIYGDMNRSGDSTEGDHQATGSNVRKHNLDTWKINVDSFRYHQQACWNCGRKANETCSGCNLARYCGSFCQHRDWEQHHQACGTNAARTLESQTAPKPTQALPGRTIATANSNSSSTRSSPTNQNPSGPNGNAPEKWRNTLVKRKNKYLC